MVIYLKFFSARKNLAKISVDVTLHYQGPRPDIDTCIICYNNYKNLYAKQLFPAIFEQKLGISIKIGPSQLTNGSSVDLR